jgi:hypothetical protein
VHDHGRLAELVWLCQELWLKVSNQQLSPSCAPCAALLCPGRLHSSCGDKSRLVMDTHLHAGVRAGAQQLCSFGRVVLLGRPQQQDVRRVQPRCGGCTNSTHTHLDANHQLTLHVANAVRYTAPPSTITCGLRRVWHASEASDMAGVQLCDTAGCEAERPTFQDALQRIIRALQACHTPRFPVLVCLAGCEHMVFTADVGCSGLALHSCIILGCGSQGDAHLLCQHAHVVEVLLHVILCVVIPALRAV